VIGIAMFVVVGLLERLALPWYYGARRTRRDEPSVTAPALGGDRVG
jgi:hypothetical protein